MFLLRTFFALALFALPLFVSAAFPPPTCQMSANPAVVEFGGSTELRWESKNASTTSITGVGQVSTSGRVNLVVPGKGVTFVGTFTGAGGVTTCKTSVQVRSGGGGNIVTDDTTTVTPKKSISSAPAPIVDQAPQGLVPCTGINCDMCKGGKLIQRVITFMIGIAIPIATLLFAWAGILYFSSGANPGNKDRAKQIFVDAFVGFLIALAAFLIVNTILNVLLNKQKFSNGSWFVISCQTDPRLGTPGNFSTINSLLQSVLPGLSVGQTPQKSIDQRFSGTGEFNSLGGSSGTGFNFNDFASQQGEPCGNGYYYMADAEEYWCQSPFNKDDIAEAKFEAVEQGTCGAGFNYSESATEYWCQKADNPDYTNEANWEEAETIEGLFPVDTNASVGLCDAGALASFGLPENFVCINKHENGCGNTTSPKSCYDRSVDGNCFSVGGTQINLTNHSVSCGGVTLPCADAWSCPSKNSAAGQQCVKYLNGQCLKAYNGYGCEVANPALYLQCKNALESSTSCALETQAAIFKKEGYGAYAISAGKCGI